jgi:hypothetical protein
MRIVSDARPEVIIDFLVFGFRKELRPAVSKVIPALFIRTDICKILQQPEKASGDLFGLRSSSRRHFRTNDFNACSALSSASRSALCRAAFQPSRSRSDFVCMLDNSPSMSTSSQSPQLRASWAAPCGAFTTFFTRVDLKLTKWLAAGASRSRRLSSDSKSGSDGGDSTATRGDQGFLESI